MAPYNPPFLDDGFISMQLPSSLWISQLISHVWGRRSVHNHYVQHLVNKHRQHQKKTKKMTLTFRLWMYSYARCCLLYASKTKKKLIIIPIELEAGKTKKNVSVPRSSQKTSSIQRYKFPLVAGEILTLIKLQSLWKSSLYRHDANGKGWQPSF